MLAVCVAARVRSDYRKLLVFLPLLGRFAKCIIIQKVQDDNLACGPMLEIGAGHTVKNVINVL